MNNLEIAIYKLNSMTNEIKVKKEEGVILDFCEDIFMRHAEVRLNLKRIEVMDI